MSLRQRGYLTEQKSYIPWKKIKRIGVYRAKGAAAQNMWDWKANVGKDVWMLRQTKMHPDMDFEHEFKRSYWQIYRNGKPFKKPVKNLAIAKITVEKWVKEYGTHG